jgi:hypothetical protein
MSLLVDISGHVTCLSVFLSPATMTITLNADPKYAVVSLALRNRHIPYRAGQTSRFCVPTSENRLRW